MMGANHGAIDHLQGVRNDPAFVQLLQDQLPETAERPSSKLPIDTRPLTELFREIPPRRTGAGNPEKTIKNSAVVGGFAPIRGADRQDERFKERPLIRRVNGPLDRLLNRLIPT